MTPNPLVILGATGMLGQALCRESLRRGITFTPMARSTPAHTVDATDFARLEKLLDELSPAAVINAIALTSLDACEQSPGMAYQTNARLAAQLAHHCTLRSVSLVQISTDHYFTGDGDRLHDEDFRVTLLNEYARTKYAGEAFAATCPRHLIVRTNIVGFRGWAGRPTFVEWAIQSLRQQMTMTLFDDFYTSSIDVDAFVAALFDLMAEGAEGTINLAAREPSSKQAFVTGLAQRLGMSTASCNTGSVRKMPGASRAESLGLDVGKAESLLGYRLPSAAAVLDSLAETYREYTREIR